MKGRFMQFLLICAVTFLMSEAFAGGPAYPKNPDPKLTPGSLCDVPSSYRYPEQIPYCERDVNSYFKEIIFSNYRRELGYRLNGERSTFKIDHFIPLCAGGSNREDNLWPQHVSVSKV